MATYLLKVVREKRATLAMNITGFIVGLPIFCDSGYIVLNGLNQSLARRTQVSLAAMATSLATGLYSVHCLIPPHPGATAAAGLLGADLGKFMLMGVLVAIPASIVGYAWARFAGKKDSVILSEDKAEAQTHPHQSPLRAFLPVIVPIVLIAAGSFLRVDGARGLFTTVVVTLGDPAVALSIGILLALTAKGARDKEAIAPWLQDSAEKAGGILVIIGAGGAFGAVLQATDIGRHLSSSLPLEQLGLLFPFLVTSILKTAQGSSTVAIMTAASIIQPLLPVLGFDTPDEIILCTLAMGAGSMTLSHANDAYFWVIGKFSGLGVRPMLRVYSVATLWMGLTSLLMVLLLSQVWMNR
jgi:GntP family gluconate:H+ symporter